MKLKAHEIKKVRTELLRKQHYKCPLCGHRINPIDAALDHCHTTGHVRRVLHKNCNSVEGRLLHWIRRVKNVNSTDFLKNLIAYWSEDYSQNPIHPRHYTDVEKEILKLKRARRRVKTERAKQRYTNRINELQEINK